MNSDNYFFLENFIDFIILDCSLLFFVPFSFFFIKYHEISGLVH